MRTLIVKLHIYAGLLTFSQLVIYGIAGLPPRFNRRSSVQKLVSTIRYVPSRPPVRHRPAGRGRSLRTLHLPTRPMPGWFLRRTPENDLLLDFYNINGIWRVVVLEREHRLRIQQIDNRFSLFLGDVHAITTGDDAAPRVIRVWAIYNELAMWCLLAFSGSGVYLWLSAQPRAWWAWGLLATGTATFAALWRAFR